MTRRSAHSVSSSASHPPIAPVPFNTALVTKKRKLRPRGWQIQPLRRAQCARPVRTWLALVEEALPPAGLAQPTPQEVAALSALLHHPPTNQLRRRNEWNRFTRLEPAVLMRLLAQVLFPEEDQA